MNRAVKLQAHIYEPALQCGCKALELLCEVAPDTSISDLYEVLIVMAHMQSLPKLRCETEEQANPMTISELRERGARVMAAIEAAGLVEHE